jgi:broad specificity phosphatase PhoE
MLTIGLVRHFKVIQPKPEKKWMTSVEFKNWVEEYDHCDVILQPSTIDRSDWDMCFSSDLSRAVKTSIHVYKDGVIFTEQLREINIRPFIHTNIKLHYKLWLYISRMSWQLIHKSDPDSKHKIIIRVQNIVDRIEQLDATRVLVVSHGALMWYIQKELRKRRYKGPMFVYPEHGKLYSYQRSHREDAHT